jgi:UTP---glucose-1-phosphate uridylyltransferase
LEIAEVDIEHLELRGSLHVIADRVMGQIDEEGILKYSDQVGCLRLRHVIIDNRGFDSTASNSYWGGKIARHELCEIRIRGNGEFVAENVVLRGNMRIEVEDGFKVTAFEEAGELKFKKEAAGR